jgi:hypothetical protein
MFIHREEAYYTREEAEDRGLKGRAHLSVAKQRNGPTGVIQLAWFEKFTRFENLSERPYDEAPRYDDGGLTSYDDEEVSFP